MKRIITCAALATVLGATHAFAVPTTLDFTGISTPVAFLDWAPGNALAKNAVPLPVNPLTKKFDLYYQARLGDFKDTSNITIGGTGLATSYEITAVIGFGEVGTTSLGGLAAANANFNLDTTRPTYVRFYKDSSKDSNDLTGAGFANGNLFLEGRVTEMISSNFSTTGRTDTLDKTADGNQWGTTRTVVGSGGTFVNVHVDAINQDENVIATPIDFTNFIFKVDFDTSNNLPFTKVNPAKNMYDGTGLIASNVGALNGFSGPDMLFQADAITAFDLSPVPEPSTLAFTGLGLLLAGAIFRRKAK